MATEEIQSTLNNLIETCKDGEQGFTTAAEKVKESSLKSLFAKYASQRAQCALELQSLVTQMGGDPATSGHVAGTLHRGWLNLKAALSRNEDQAIVDECEAGEDATMKNYGEALSFQLPPDVAAIVQRQYADVREAHSVIRNLKHGRAATAGSSRI
jgi:uncharacterized protein (TIGR02284 family)